MGDRFRHRLLVGDPDLPAASVRRRARRLTTATIVVANVVGAAVVLCFSLFALPKPDVEDDVAVLVVNLPPGCVGCGPRGVGRLG